MSTVQGGERSVTSSWWTRHRTLSKRTEARPLGRPEAAGALDNNVDGAHTRALAGLSGLERPPDPPGRAGSPSGAHKSQPTKARVSEQQMGVPLSPSL